jgi:tRNA/tmRNA/rRNA uracil-C5-methylase (TrmA/RlmC/RlmD family)
MVTMTNFIKNITDMNDYTETLKRISDNLNQLIFVKSFYVCEYKDTVKPQPSDLLRAIFTKQSIRFQMHDELGDYCILPDNVLVEKIMNRMFVISPNSFFQVNTEMTEILYQKIRELMTSMIGLKNVSNKNTLIDMYCGTGSIGICLADMFDHIIGIDVIESSINDAKMNAKINNVNNCNFILGRCENMMTVILLMCI